MIGLVYVFFCCLEVFDLAIAVIAEELTAVVVRGNPVAVLRVVRVVRVMAWSTNGNRKHFCAEGRAVVLV